MSVGKDQVHDAQRLHVSENGICLTNQDMINRLEL